MSKFTTEVRYICETANGLTESVGLDRVPEIITGAEEDIFGGVGVRYPIFDESYRSILNYKILSEYTDENHYLKATGRCSVDSFEFDYTLSGVTDLGYCESVVVGVRATSEEDDRIKFLVNLLKEDDESTYEEDYTGMDYFTDTVVKLI